MIKDNRLWWRVQLNGDLGILDCCFVRAQQDLTDSEYRYFINDKLEFDCLSEQTWAICERLA